MSAEVKPMGSVRIRGERFDVEVEEGSVYVSHPRWSIVGHGATLAEAVRDVLTELPALRSHFEDPSELTVDAMELRDYLFRAAGAGAAP